MNGDPQQDSYQPVARDRTVDRLRHEQIPGYIQERALLGQNQASKDIPEVTAVGRFLKPNPGQKHLYKVIAIKADGTVQTLINTPAT